MELTDEEGLALLLKASVKTALGAGGSGGEHFSFDIPGNIQILEHFS